MFSRSNERVLVHCELLIAASLVATTVSQQSVAATKNQTETLKPIAEYIVFYAGKVDEAWVGDVRVIPQLGDFYGGWVTPNLEGKIKGAPGTNHW